MGAEGSSEARGLNVEDSLYSDHALLIAVDRPINRFCDDFSSSLVSEIVKDDASRFGHGEFEEVTGYDVKRILGNGAEAVVYEAVKDRTMIPVAVKRYTVVKNSDGVVPREVTISEKLNHPNCLKILDSFIGTSGAFILVMPLAESGALKITGTPELTPTAGCVFLHEMASALAHMHSKNIVHRDVKPANILIYDDRYVLCDYSISAQLPADETMISGVVGTSVFMAPEISVNMYDPKPVDIWALGISLYGLLYGKYPWTLSRLLDGTSVTGLQNMAKNESKGELTFPESPVVPNELIALIRRMLEREPEKRITACEIEENEWLRDQVKRWRDLVAFLLTEDHDKDEKSAECV